MEAPEGLDATIAAMKANLDARQNPSTYQPPPPGPVETRIQQLEDMVGKLVRKLIGPPMTDEERAEWAEKIQGELTPVRESRKEHDCEKAHPDQSHEMWEETS